MATKSEAELISVTTELQGATYRHVPGYIATLRWKAVPNRSKDYRAAVSNSAHSNGTSAAALPFVDDLREWLSSTQSHQPLSYEIQISTTILPLIRTRQTSHGQPASIVIAAKQSKMTKICPWADVQVLGLVESGPGLFANDASVLRFCKIARDLLISRSERRFLHAFHLYNSSLELWTFDRAGGVSSEVFSITENPAQFARIMAERICSDVVDLGLNKLLKEDDQGVFIDLPFLPSRLYLVEDAFFKPECLIGPGTVCFKARGSHVGAQIVVVKFVWTKTGSAERKLLAVANTKNVVGILKLEAFQDLGDVADFRHRRELQLEKLYDFSPDGQQGQQGKASFEPHSRLHFECIVTSPLGRQLDEFSSMTELFTVFCDITIALQSLYLDANILHRDISRHNIIIVQPLSPSSPTGILIDLDAGLDLTEPSSDVRQLIGTSGFMACGILGGDDHTYRHDLESVFYVFLWLAICHDGKTSRNIPVSSRLHSWMGSPGTGVKWVDVFKTKRADMQPTAFLELVTTEFRGPFRPYISLAMDVHGLLFPLRDGKLFIGTDSGRAAAESLFRKIAAVFKSYV